MRPLDRGGRRPGAVGQRLGRRGQGPHSSFLRAVGLSEITRFSNVSFIILISNHKTYIHGIYMHIRTHGYVHVYNNFIMYTM